MAIIENGVLKRISNEDLDAQGKYTIPKDVIEVAPGAFSGLTNLKCVLSKNSETIINKYAFLKPEEYVPPLEYSKSSKVAINMLWLNKSLDSKQRLIFKEDWTNVDLSKQSVTKRPENYSQLLNSAIDWSNKNPNHTVRIWYDSHVTTHEQVNNTIEEIRRLTDGRNNIQLKDIRNIPIVSENADVFSENTGFYFKIDLLKLILTHHSLANEGFDFSVFTDIGVKPLEEKILFSKTARVMLTNHGLLTNGHENQFIQAENSKEVNKSLALIINANLQRCWQGLQCKDYALRNYILSKLFRAIYNDTTNMLHFLSSGFKNGQILIKEKNDGVENWVNYDPDTHGHMPLGNYFHQYGAYNNFKTLENPIYTLKSYHETFYKSGVDPKGIFKFIGLRKFNLARKNFFELDHESIFGEELELISSIRGHRDNIEVPFGRDHSDPIPEKISIPISPLKILNYSDNNTSTIAPFSIPNTEDTEEEVLSINARLEAALSDLDADIKTGSNSPLKGDAATSVSMSVQTLFAKEKNNLSAEDKLDLVKCITLTKELLQSSQPKDEMLTEYQTLADKFVYKYPDKTKMLVGSMAVLFGVALILTAVLVSIATFGAGTPLAIPALAIGGSSIAAGCSLAGVGSIGAITAVTGGIFANTAHQGKIATSKQDMKKGLTYFREPEVPFEQKEDGTTAIVSPKKTTI